MSTDNTGYRVLFIIDATGSMGVFLNSLTVSLYQVASIMKLTTRTKSEIGILWYRDYDQPIDKVTGFSGYTTDIGELLTFLGSLRPDGGGDAPEATKTALNKALDMHLVDSKTVVFLYADAPPHHPTTGGQNRAIEEKNVKENDWIQLCQLYKQTGCRVYPMINVAVFATSSFYMLLSHYTQGKTLYLRMTDVETISKSTINLFLSLCKAEYEPTDVVQCLTFPHLNVSSFENETNAQHEDLLYLPATASSKQASISIEPFNAEPVDFMIADLKFMLDKFKNDETYQSTVYQILESMMTPVHVLALTHNSILGLLWRLICGQRQDDRRENLLIILSNTLNAMDADAQFKVAASNVRTWLEESYNAKEEILSQIAQVPEHLPALVLTLDQKMERRELMEITRSCNPQVLRTVMNLLNHLTVVTNRLNLPESYLPLNMDDKEIFQLLPHLLAEGLKVSLRPAAILAMLCILSKNQILSERAERFLLSIKSKWMDMEASENYSYSFIKLGVQLPQFFTESENLFFRKFSLVGGLKINASTHVTIKQSFHPKVIEVHKDTKIACPACHIIRSTTLFPDVATSCCALCLDRYDRKNTPETCADDSSHLAQCKVCTCLYAVVRYTELNAEPKCFYCRELQPAPYRRCTECFNKYVHYDSTESPESTFTCAECQYLTTSETIVAHQVEIRTLINTNRIPIFENFNIQIDDGIDLLSNEWSLFKLKGKIQLIENKDMQSTVVSLMHQKKPILNVNEVLEQISSWVKSGRSEYVTCYICCDDVRRDQISTACGNRSCHADACVACLTKWYQAVMPGSVVLPAHLLCPFCKQAPNGKALKRFNKQACTILKVDLKNDIDEHWYYGWCIDCYRVKKAQEKTCCADGTIPTLNEFVCEECIELRQVVQTKDVKYCPGMNEDGGEVCGVAIAKNGGCNHMTCTACQAHWCWLCVKTFGDSIYEHLGEAHGNYGFEY